jgi:hypothetical protein
MGPTDVTVISVVGQIGALIGGTTLGYISTFLGKASRPCSILQPRTLAE